MNNVFGGGYASGYDALYQDKDYAGECDLVEQALRRFGSAGPLRMLDVGCGTGGHALELAARGHAVDGVDLSGPMIEIARAKARGKPGAERINWHCADARNFEFAGSFDAAIMMFAVIGYLNDNASVLAALQNVRRHLRTGAVFACDFWYGPAVLMQRPGDRVRVVNSPRGKLIRATHTELHVNTCTADVHFDVFDIAADKVVSESSETHRMRFFFSTDLSLLLERAGFELASISAFPSLDQPLSSETWNAFAVARAA